MKPPNLEPPMIHNDQARELPDLIAELESWQIAYPLHIFPEPDFAAAAQALRNAGQTLDAISASNMRHVVSKIVPVALEAIARARAEALEEAAALCQTKFKRQRTLYEATQHSVGLSLGRAITALKAPDGTGGGEVG